MTTATQTGNHVSRGSRGALTSMIRPEWNPVTIAMTVLGFMVFWPLGLAMIGYIVFGERLDAFKDDANRGVDSALASFGRFKGSMPTGFGRTGNVAFDDWRFEEMRRLDEKRAELAAMEHEFAEYQRELRRAKDAEEFDKFLKTRNGTVDNG